MSLSKVKNSLGVWSDGDAGKIPLPPYGSLCTHQCYSHLCFWPIFYITKLYFYLFFIIYFIIFLIFYFIIFMMQLLQHISLFFIEYIENLRHYPLQFISFSGSRSFTFFLMLLLQHIFKKIY